MQWKLPVCKCSKILCRGTHHSRDDVALLYYFCCQRGKKRTHLIKYSFEKKNVTCLLVMLPFELTNSRLKIGQYLNLTIFIKNLMMEN